MLSVFFAFSILIQLLLPFAIGYLLIRRYGTSWRLFAMGALVYLTFWITQMPAAQALAGTEFYQTQIATLPALWATLALGLLTAALEVGIRCGGFYLLRKSTSQWGEGATLVAGHGGVESMLVGLRFLFGFISILMVTQTGVASLNLSEAETVIAQQQVNEFWSLPWYLPLASALQTLVALVLQYALGAMVWHAMTHKVWVWIGAAVMWQLVMGTVTYILSLIAPDLLTTGTYLLIGAANVAIVVLFYRKLHTNENVEIVEA